MDTFLKGCVTLSIEAPHSESRLVTIDLKCLICHVTFPDQVVKGPCGLMDGTPHRIYTLSSFVARGIVVVNMFLICHAM